MLHHALTRGPGQLDKADGKGLTCCQSAVRGLMRGTGNLQATSWRQQGVVSVTLADQRTLHLLRSPRVGLFLKAVLQSIHAPARPIKQQRVAKPLLLYALPTLSPSYSKPLLVYAPIIVRPSSSIRRCRSSAHRCYFEPLFPHSCAGQVLSIRLLQP